MLTDANEAIKKSIENNGKLIECLYSLEAKEFLHKTPSEFLEYKDSIIYLSGNYINSWSVRLIKEN